MGKRSVPAPTPFRSQTRCEEMRIIMAAPPIDTNETNCAVLVRKLSSLGTCVWELQN